MLVGALFPLAFVAQVLGADEVPWQGVDQLIQSSCVSCHDDAAEGGLNLKQVGRDLSQPDLLLRWERVYDRIVRAEMPPPGEKQPAEDVRKSALTALEKNLNRASETLQSRIGRTILRRVTRREYEYLVNDLLGMDVELASLLPAENAAGFSTVADKQGLSPQHIHAYFEAADRAIDRVLHLDPAAEKRQLARLDLKQNLEVRKHIDDLKQKNERVYITQLDDAVVMYLDGDGLFRLPEAPATGVYRLRAEVSAHQATRPVIFTLNYRDYQRGVNHLIKTFDIPPGSSKVVETEVKLTKGQYVYAGVLNLQFPENGEHIYNLGAEKYTGSGIAVKWLEADGPLNDQWPPQATTDLLGDIQIKKLDSPEWDPWRAEHVAFQIMAGDDPAGQLRSLIERFAPRAFRRPLENDEVEALLEIGVKTFDHFRQQDGFGPDKAMDRAVRSVLRSILASPQFLFETAPPGPLDDYVLASRLAMFLWKGLPDEELFQTAFEGRLHQRDVLREQTNRMLNDPRSGRMVRDFLGQWLHLDDIEATFPDSRLYPEFDLHLMRSMLAETQGYVAHLIEHDLSSDLLIDSDFSILNRRLAEHYGIEGVEGQEMRRVELPAGSPRGGLITQGSILKITANGTTTSPVKRGSWVLTSLLGTPPSPPPPMVGSVEPDTRGSTTIRELLDKHRNLAVCASCHRTIDPPGFAMECFDVIGGFRERYRVTGAGEPAVEKLYGRSIWEYRMGPAVDVSGEMPSGEAFRDVREFKSLLMDRRDDVARNLLKQWIVYATGAELQFADRDDLERLLADARESGYGMRNMLHQIIQSDLFLKK